MSGFTVQLLPPPSLNNAFVNAKAGKGRFKSGEYRNWCAYACAAIKSAVPGQSRVGGAFMVSINLPRKMQGDMDNRVKGILDALVTSTRIDDDKHMDELRVCRRAEHQYAIVTVSPIGDSA